MLLLPPGLLCLSALCIYLPQMQLAGAQPHCSLTRGCTAYPPPGKFRPRVQGVTGRQQVSAGSLALF